MVLDITGEETQAELEAMLEQYGDVEVDDEDGEQTPDTETDDAQTGETEEQDTPPVSGAQQDEPVIETRDGKNTIPYRVLESERAQRAQAAAELAALKQQLEEANYREQLLTNQVRSAGLTPRDKPQTLSPETLQELREEMPEVAAAVESLASQTAHFDMLLKQQAQELERFKREQQKPREYEAQTAFIETPRLVDWRDNDPAKFQFATQVDSILEADPAWQSRPIKERFEETVRRTAAAFGESDVAAISGQSREKILASAKTKAQAHAELPASPSQVGAGEQVPRSKYEQLANASSYEIEEAFKTMSAAEINKILAQAGY